MIFKVPVYYIIFVFIFFILSAKAQQFELGKVSVREISEKTHSVDTTAPAAVLYEKGKTYFKYAGYYWLLITEVDRRIKIYKKEGYDYAQQELTFYEGEGNLNTFSDAYTYNLIGDSIIKTKVGADSEFITSTGRHSQSKKIFFPNVKEGSVIEFKYIITRQWRGYIPTWYFQEEIPMNNSVYSIAIPAYFTHHGITSGNLKINTTPMEIGRGDGFQENRVTYSITNAPAMKEQPYINNINNYRAKVKHELAAVTSYGGEETQYATSWKSLVLNLFKDESFGKQLESKAYFKKDIDALLKPGMTVNEKIEAIFEYVQKKMNWNEYLGYYCDEGVKEAYKLGHGNTADINLMLVAIMQYCGIDAAPVLIATRNKGIPTYPSIETFNYVVCGVQWAGSLILLDATSKYTVPGMIRPMAINSVGRIIRPNGSAIEVDLTPNKSAKSVYNVFATIASDGNVSGKIRTQYYDYMNLSMRERGLLKKQADYINALEKELDGAEINDYKLKDDVPNLLMEEYSFENNRLTDIVNNKIIFNPMLFFAMESNPFLEETRLYPVDFTVAHQNKYMINFNLPEGYIVESFPTTTSIAMEDGVANFKYTIDVKNNKLQLNVVFDVNQSFIEKENYKALKDFYSRALAKQNEKIILKKV